MIEKLQQSRNVFLAEAVLNQITCFQSNGSKEDLVDVQYTIPDKNSFEVSNPLIDHMETTQICFLPFEGSRPGRMAWNQMSNVSKY